MTANRRAFLKRTATASILFSLPLRTLAAPPGQKNTKSKSKGDPRDAGFGNTPGLIQSGISAAAARDLFRGSGDAEESYKPLPPGIRKNLARGKPLPPGIAKTRLPGGYVGRLPHYSGYEWT